MTLKVFLLFAVSVTWTSGQRPQFAGSRPIGYPEVYNRTTTEGLGNRAKSSSKVTVSSSSPKILNLDEQCLKKDIFGEDGATTPRLPLEANGDRELIDRLSKLPIDKQPFWFINWQALEANRQKPQTYPQRPSTFLDPITSNTGTSNTNTGIPNTQTETSNSKTPDSTNSGTTSSSTGTQNTNSGISNNQAASQTVSNTQSLDTTSSNSELQNRFSGQNTGTGFVGNLGIAKSDYGSKKYTNNAFKPRTPIID